MFRFFPAECLIPCKFVFHRFGIAPSLLYCFFYCLLSSLLSLQSTSWLNLSPSSVPFRQTGTSIRSIDTIDATSLKVSPLCDTIAYARRYDFIRTHFFPSKANVCIHIVFIWLSVSGFSMVCSWNSLGASISSQITRKKPYAVIANAHTICIKWNANRRFMLF